MKAMGLGVGRAGDYRGNTVAKQKISFALSFFVFAEFWGMGRQQNVC